MNACIREVELHARISNIHVHYASLCSLYVLIPYTNICFNINTKICVFICMYVLFLRVNSLIGRTYAPDSASAEVYTFILTYKDYIICAIVVLLPTWQL